MFNAKVTVDGSLVCGTNTLTNTGRITTSSGYKESTATVTVNKTCNTPGCTQNCTNTPPELPHTGPTETLLGFIGLGAIVGAAAYFIASRKALANRK